MLIKDPEAFGLLCSVQGSVLHCGWAGFSPQFLHANGWVLPAQVQTTRSGNSFRSSHLPLHRRRSERFVRDDELHTRVSTSTIAVFATEVVRSSSCCRKESPVLLLRSGERL